MSEQLTPTVWLIDDDDRFRERLERALSRRGYHMCSFADAQAALGAHAVLTSLDPTYPLIALVDLRLAGEWGLHVTRALLERQPDLHVIILTAYGSIATAIEAVRLGARDYLQKPVSVSEIEARISAACQAFYAEGGEMATGADKRGIAGGTGEEAEGTEEGTKRAEQKRPGEDRALDQETPELTLADVEWEHINRVLTECNGNIRQAARQLGIHRRTLQRKLAKLPNKR